MPTGIQGQPRRYHKKFLFAVEIAGIEVAWFESCSAPKAEVAVIEQFEGGNHTAADKSPGKAKFEDLVLRVGVTDNVELYNWFLQVVDAGANTGEIDDLYKRSISIVRLDRNGQPRARFNLTKAWPSKYDAGDFDAKADENAIEELTLTYHHFERKAA